MDHIISADKSETIEIVIKTMDWAGEITDLFHYENKDAIHQAVQGLRNRYNGEFDATILLNQLDQLDQRGQSGTQDSHWTFTSPAEVIRAAICLLGGGHLGRISNVCFRRHIQNFGTLARDGSVRKLQWPPPMLELF